MIVHICAELIQVPLLYFEVCGMCFLTFCEFVLLGREMLIISSRPVQRQQRGGKVICGLFGLGLPELVVIAGVVAFLFRPKNLPDLGRSLGKTVRSFSQVWEKLKILLLHFVLIVLPLELVVRKNPCLKRRQ
jgi:sec-independent protein translocase protein TatA